MFNSGSTLYIIVHLVFCSLLLLGCQEKSEFTSPLASLFNERDDYLVYIGTPLKTPTQWTKVTGISGGLVQCDNKQKYSLAQVSTYYVAYPNGQIVVQQNGNLPLPASVTGISPSPNPVNDVLTLDQIKAGNKYLKIQYGKSASKPKSPNHYSTKLTNISKQKLKITKFGGYDRVGESWHMNNVARTFYTPEEFVNWYGQKKEWIEPGETVADANNYGSPPVLWAYYFITEDKKTLVAGGILE